MWEISYSKIFLILVFITESIDSLFFPPFPHYMTNDIRNRYTQDVPINEGNFISILFDKSRRFLWNTSKFFLSWKIEWILWKCDIINILETFDFIIVGSGSSGSVLANRLSEIQDWKILLLEAGNAANELNKVPLLAPIFAATGYNWNFTTERQEGICEGMVDKICAWPRGKALGGKRIFFTHIICETNSIYFCKQP